MRLNRGTQSPWFHEAPRQLLGLHNSCRYVRSRGFLTVRAVRKAAEVLKRLVHIEIFSGTVTGLSPVGPYLTGLGEETSVESFAFFPAIAYVIEINFLPSSIKDSHQCGILKNQGSSPFLHKDDYMLWGSPQYSYGRYCIGVHMWVPYFWRPPESPTIPGYYLPQNVGFFIFFCIPAVYLPP